PGLTGATWIGAGDQHMCAVTGGEVYCWGRGYEGQLGPGSTDATEDPQLVPLMAAATQVTAGQSFSCALTVAGDVYCWGYGGNGELGNDSMSSSTPLLVPGISSVVQISARGSHTCAREMDGSAYCWGQNGSGQLGGGDSNFHPAPVQVS